ncbi:MAG: hypothetical protein LBR10_01435 [Prevotellaceae bacterium]|jgi:hypothetical protein|nr:hypothetical protein [Prevotellaceae bacterium]
MNIENLKIPMAEIYYLANTPTYIYRNIVRIFSNIDLDVLSEKELDVLENSIKDDEQYFLYLLIFVRIKNNFKIDNEKYKSIKWGNEFISYCKSKEVNTSVSKFSMFEGYTNNVSNQKVSFNA